MDICLLKCGSVFEHLEHISGDYDVMFANLFNNHSFDINWHIYNVFKGQYPADLDQFNGFLSSGSLSGVYEDLPWIKEYRQFIKHLHLEKYRFVGICFGHQMIAQALGGKVVKANQGWGLGIKTISVDHTQSWMNPLPPDNIELIFSHQDQVIRLPDNARVLGTSAHCPVAMYMVDDHFLGIQAHPEFTREYSRAAVEYRRQFVDGITIDNALHSLSRKTDEKLLAHWIVNFFSSKNP